MKASIWINSILFKNSTKISLKSNSIVVFVGPNNAGKSRTLQELYQYTKSNDKSNKIIIDQIEIKNSGDEDSLLEQLKSRLRGTSYHYEQDNSAAYVMSADNIKQAWKNFDSLTTNSRFQLSHFLVKQLNTTQRLSLVTPPENLDFIIQAPKHPIHFIKEDDQKENDFSR